MLTYQFFPLHFALPLLSCDQQYLQDLLTGPLEIYDKPCKKGSNRRKIIKCQKIIIIIF